MLLSAPYINLPFAFPFAKEKHKCISVYAWTQPASPRTVKRKEKINIFFFSCRVHADGTSVHVDAGKKIVKKDGTGESRAP
jgi:hypothetical protein